VIESKENNFIECFPKVISDDNCQKIIKAFQSSEKLQTPGVIGDGRVDRSIKSSTDITCKFSNDSFPNRYLYVPLTEALEEYTRKYTYLQQLKDDGVDWTLSNHYTIQAYNQGEGYFKLHCEKQLLLPDRILAWMVYLNDAESGTEFPYQGVTLTPRAGDLWIWPAYWTHAHKGVVPNQGFKCILTGWCVVKVTVPFSK
tara:strand:- start:38 stop:634 length:597 start_codon:yes stop_codon:yes gene_type:complete